MAHEHNRVALWSAAWGVIGAYAVQDPERFPSALSYLTFALNRYQRVLRAYLSNQEI